jgi:hypothetical protein
MMPCEGLTFFWFFEFVTSDLRSTWNDAAQKLPLAPRQCDLVKKWRIVNPKMIFAKNQEVYFLAIKYKTIPVPTKSAGTCAKFKNNLQRLLQWNESWYVYPRWSNIYVWCFFQLLTSRFHSRFTKNPISALRKWKKHFSSVKTKIGLRGFPRQPNGHARVRYGLVPTNYAMLMAESSSFNLKVMQPQMW